MGLQVAIIENGFEMNSFEEYKIVKNEKEIELFNEYIGSYYFFESFCNELDRIESPFLSINTVYCPKKCVWILEDLVQIRDKNEWKDDKYDKNVYMRICDLFIKCFTLAVEHDKSVYFN